MTGPLESRFLSLFGQEAIKGPWHVYDGSEQGVSHAVSTRGDIYLVEVYSLRDRVVQPMLNMVQKTEPYMVQGSRTFSRKQAFRLTLNMM